MILARPRWMKGLATCGLLLGLAPTAALADHAAISAVRLGTYAKLDRAGVTVSGISSGAFFAHQFHVAYSGLVKGAGMVAGGLYACAEQVDEIVPPHPFTGIPKSVAAALAVCTRFARSGFALSFWRLPEKPDAALSRDSALSAHAAGKIDDPANLAASRVFLFRGDKDTGVPRATIAEMKRLYGLMGVPAENVAEQEGPDAEHGMPIKAQPPTPSGPHCALHDDAFLVACDYGAAELVLRHLYPGAASATGTAAGRIVGFDQTEFFDGEPRTSLNAAGYLYVPRACENDAPGAGACRLHVAFHGCQQYVDKIHDRFFRDAGYNAIADANSIVVLYPQAAPWRRLADPSGFTANPQGCWDWWGYTGDDDYFTRHGKQMRAVRAMIGRMLP
jgi:poly(3-hydroxybutyrate) depolymerase